MDCLIICMKIHFLFEEHSEVFSQTMLAKTYVVSDYVRHLHCRWSNSAGSNSSEAPPTTDDPQTASSQLKTFWLPRVEPFLRNSVASLALLISQVTATSMTDMALNFSIVWCLHLVTTRITRQRRMQHHGRKDLDRSIEHLRVLIINCIYTYT